MARQKRRLESATASQRSGFPQKRMGDLLFFSSLPRDKDFLSRVVMHRYGPAFENIKIFRRNLLTID
jgi:hypothetical protein